MANENKEIGDIVKKCKILLLDIEGTTTSISFVKDKLFPYAEQNVKQFLDSQWENIDVKEVVAALRKLAVEDKEGSVEGVVTIPGEDASKEEQIEGLVNNVKWQMAADRKAGPLKQLQGLIWKQGYDNGDIKGHVYDDVSAALEAWHTDDQKVYIYSSGSVQAQKMLFGQSMAGDLLKYIDGHFDTAVGAKQEASSYTNIVEKIGCKADEILFLTDIVKEAEAARAAGLRAALVSRAGNAPLPAAAAFPVLHSLAELTLSNKRKPEPQEETPAAKILKTDSENEIKTSTIETADPKTVPKESEAKMEVEETVTSSEEAVTSAEVVDVKELDSNEAVSVTAVIDVPPVAVEDPDEENKTEQKKTVVEAETAEDVKEKNGDAPVPEETPPATLMEVEEIPDDKPLPEVDEIIEDVVPIIEEPEDNEEMEELKNVGDVLEKECDEILSKVNNVTNLDNITVKPLLNPIAEETMETDNTDSNDIVNRILDTEMDLEMKQCADIDPNTVTEMAEEAKTEVDTNLEASHTEKEKIVADKKEIDTEKKGNDTEKEGTVTENNVEKKVEESSPMEEDVKDKQLDKAQNQKSPAEISSTEAKESIESKQNEAAEEKSATGETVSEFKPIEDEIANAETVKETKTEEVLVKEDKPMETTPQEKKVETEEPQLNGMTENVTDKPANGDAKVALNGDAEKEEEISSRLNDAVENGKVNGSNGESVEKGQGDCKVEAELNDIKVKSVTVDEPRTEPVEQPTEA